MLQIHLLHIQINLQTPNPRQIIAVICQNADEHIHVEQPPLLIWSTMMAATVALTVAIGGCRHHHHLRSHCLCHRHRRHCCRQAVAAENASNIATAAIAAAATATSFSASFS